MSSAWTAPRCCVKGNVSLSLSLKDCLAPRTDLMDIDTVNRFMFDVYVHTVNVLSVRLIDIAFNGVNFSH